jgi:hypothetical protein
VFFKVSHVCGDEIGSSVQGAQLDESEVTKSPLPRQIIPFEHLFLAENEVKSVSFPNHCLCVELLFE